MTDHAVPFDARSFGRRLAGDQVHLRLLATTDMHVHLHPYDYYGDRPDDSIGLARVAGHVRQLRQTAQNALLMDIGDCLQGSPMGDYVAYERGVGPDRPHPAIVAMNALGVDAATLGNHDFNFGLDHLKAAIDGADFPVVSANTITHAGATPDKDRTLVPPFALLEREMRDGDGRRHRIRIGVIGFLPPQIVIWDRRHLSGRITTRDIVESARAHIPRLRAAGADIVVALSHSGIEGEFESATHENATRALSTVPGIDAILAGHTHQTFPGPAHHGQAGIDVRRGTLNGVPTVMPGFWGSHLGMIDLALHRCDGAWRIAAFDVAAHPIAARAADGVQYPLIDSDPAILTATQDVHRETLAYIRRPVGRTTAPLNSYFTQIADCASLQLVNAAQSDHVARAIAGTPDADLPLLSAAAPFKVGGRGRPDQYIDLPAGDLVLRNIADLYLNPNLVRAIRISGAELLEWLERSAGQFHRIRPGGCGQTLLNADFPSYNFDVIDGVTYAIDLSQPSRFDLDGNMADPDAHRIVALCHDGRPVAPDQMFVLATNSYRAAGGGTFPATGRARVIYRSHTRSRDALHAYVARNGVITPQRRPTWSFVPMPETSVQFDTGPGAIRHLEAIAHLSPEPLGQTADGFLRLHLHL
ncbi:bifunctional 2',3'-cyclic-nucleotide 2'-phosphodiesterase/3'-nucleotidase [Oceaniglobus indicus]|uniref:bifunctional 2',3'-cyclic-nucleotide 2'-phosphodiesterase/3'-nucleotidase n=1 Tax=Oceaniglobus indicus TaxID=2047749 RepID=UPI000C198E47|nr:bifunctional 2',3'-cyclic-nucleotide 2'-phosphodiesterase/3'-nucleotidase [Oceaniglobus indicus]